MPQIYIYIIIIYKKDITKLNIGKKEIYMHFKIIFFFDIKKMIYIISCGCME